MRDRRLLATASSAVKAVAGSATPQDARLKPVATKSATNVWRLAEAPSTLFRGGRALLVFPETQEVVGTDARVAAPLAGRLFVEPKVLERDLRELGVANPTSVVRRLKGLLTLRRLFADQRSQLPGDATPPDHAVLNLSVTEFCNLSCPHCYSDSSPARRGGMEDAAAVVDDFVSSFKGRERVEVALTGGEPTLWKPLPEVLDRAAAHLASSQAQTVYVNTNGTAITDEQARAFALGKVRVALSVDGPDAPTHDRIRGRGAFERMVKGAARLRDAGAWFGANVFVHALNVDRLEETFDLAVSLGARTINAFAANRLGRAEPQVAAIRGELPDRVPDRELYRTHHAILQRRPDLVPYLQESIFLGQLQRIRAHKRTRCGLGRHPTFYVSSDGSVYPDLAMFHPSYRLGHVSEGFAALAEHPILEAFRQRDPVAEREECVTCALRNFCGGGCPGENLHAAGDLVVDDEMCRELFDGIEELLWILAEAPSYLKDVRPTSAEGCA